MELACGVVFYSPPPGHKHEIPDKFVRGMKSALYDLWWTSLQTIRTQDRREVGKELNPCGGLIDLWCEFGIALGLDEDEEQAVHEGRKQRTAQLAGIITQQPVDHNISQGSREPE